MKPSLLWNIQFDPNSSLSSKVSAHIHFEKAVLLATRSNSRLSRRGHRSCVRPPAPPTQLHSFVATRSLMRSTCPRPIASGIHISFVTFFRLIFGLKSSGVTPDTLRGYFLFLFTRHCNRELYVLAVSLLGQREATKSGLSRPKPSTQQRRA